MTMTMSMTRKPPQLSLSPVSLSLGSPALLRNLVTEAAQTEIDSDTDTDALDLSGMVWTEHINLVVGNKAHAEYFYVTFLGLSRDSSTQSFHFNLGQQQFHLAEAKAKANENENGGEPAQRVAGSIGLVVPDIQTVKARIPKALETLKDTQFQILSSYHHNDHNDDDDDDNDNDKDNDNCLIVQGPWGNIFYIYDVVGDDNLESSLRPPETSRKMENLHALGNSYGSHRMAVRGKPGIRFLELACPPGTSSKVGTFYKELLDCHVQAFHKKNILNVVEPQNCHDDDDDDCDNDNDNDCVGVVVSVGPGVHLVFVEQQALEEDPIKHHHYEDMKGVHVCFYAHNFQHLYQKLSDRGLIWTNPRFTHLDSCDTWEEAKSSRTLRFKDIIDLETNEKILELEHETRPLRHGQYMKTLNYDPK